MTPPPVPQSAAAAAKQSGRAKLLPGIRTRINLWRGKKQFQGANLRGANLGRVDFIGTLLLWADFAWAASLWMWLPEARFVGVILIWANLLWTILVWINLRES